MSVLKKFRKHGDKVTAAAPTTVPTYAGTGGGMRSDEFGVPYWLNEEQLRHVAKLNVEIDDDAKFWAEFRKYRVDQGIFSSRYSKPTRTASWETKDGGYDDWAGYQWSDPNAKTSGGSKSDWWTGWKSKFTWGSGKETKLALAKRAVEATVNVVDDSGSRMSVEYAKETDHPVSATDFDGRRIIVSAKPILDGLPDGQAIDIISGFGLHEASHSKYTRRLMHVLEKPEPMRPYAVSHLLMNVLEDIRIEALTSEEFPGFAPYFEDSRDYLWETGLKVKGPKEYGPDLQSKLNCVIGFCRWPQHYEGKPEFAGEFEWWRTWQQEYIDAKVEPRDAVAKALAHLRDATPEEEQAGKGKPDPRAESGTAGEASSQLDAQEQHEGELASLADAIRDFLDGLGKELADFCTHRDHDKSEQIDEKMAEDVNRRVAEDIQREAGPIIMAEGTGNPPIIITKPLEDEYSKQYGKPRRDPLVSKYRRVLVFRPAKPRHAIKLQKYGKVDSTQLWRWAGDDWRVFQHKEIHDQPQARVYLLVDVSGSMGGSKVESAMQVAKLFVSALTTIDGVQTKVFAHSGDTTGERAAEIYRIWEPGDPITRLGLLATTGHGNNYDGHAIAWVARELERDAQPNEQRMLLVLSDGLPSGSDYGGHMAFPHIRKVVDTHFKRGTPIVQVAIDRGLDARRQEQMFREYIPFQPGDSLDVVPARIAKILARVL